MSSVTSSSSSSSSLRSSSSSSEFALGQYQSSLGTVIPWKEKKPQLGDTLCQWSIIFLLSLVRDWLERDLLLTLALWCAEESIRSYTHNSFHLLTVKLFASSLTPPEVSFNLSLLSFSPYSWPENAKKEKVTNTDYKTLLSSEGTTFRGSCMLHLKSSRDLVSFCCLARTFCL